MASEGFAERVLEVYENGAALASSTTATSLLPASGKGFTLPAGFMKIGKSLRFFFSGRISNIVTTPGTLTLELRLGSTVVFTSGAMTLNIVAKTDNHWELSGELNCRAIGETTVTTFFPKGCKFISHSVIGSPAPTAGGAGIHLLPYNTAPAVGTGIDFTVSHKLELYATWSVSNSGNSIQLHAGHVEIPA